jgi:RHS repeat-associated protein
VPTYGYTGREPDASGLVYYRARYYDPSVGRFTARDPVGYLDGINRYAYVGNNPVNFTDPNGLLARQISNAWDQGVSYYQANAHQINEFGLGFVPGYDLYQAARNPNATGWDYAIGIAGILPGAGKGGGLVLKYGDDALDLVKRADNLPGPTQSFIQANRAQGKAGEAITEAVLKQQDAFAGKHVTIETSTGQRTVIDFVENLPGGAKGVVETKTGNATLTPGQRQLFDDIQNGRPVIPRGANAEEAGLRPNEPVTIRTCRIDRPCP